MLEDIDLASGFQKNHQASEYTVKEPTRLPDIQTVILVIVNDRVAGREERQFLQVP